jgi:hypothetical protein
MPSPFKGALGLQRMGTETPFPTRTGRRLLYCYNPKQDRHAYLDLGSDVILTDDEALNALGII